MCTPGCLERAKAGAEGEPLGIGALPGHWEPEPGLRREKLPLSFEGRDFLGYVVAPPAAAGPRPAVLVVHNFQGLKFFDVQVAEYWARVGYVGVAVDLYGDMMPADERLWPSDGNVGNQMKWLQKAFQAMVDVDHDFGKFRRFLKAWIDAALELPVVDPALPPAMMGYCFGGVACIEAVRGGLNLSAAVSLHGLLQCGEDPNAKKYGVLRKPLVRCENKYSTQTQLYIENGELDELVQEDNLTRFIKEMDEACVKYVIHHHKGAGHGFALPKSLGPPGHLHKEGDRQSTLAMLAVFQEAFPSVPQVRIERNAAGTLIYGD